MFNTLSEVRLKETSIKLRCANNSILEAKGEIDLDTRIGKTIELVRYTIVSESWPNIIGGIEMQKQFGFCLKMLETGDNNVHIGVLETKFGRVITDDERLRRALRILASNGIRGIQQVIEKNTRAFMADNWDIGCTDLVKHEIVTYVNTKPWRQPIHLVDKLNETVNNLLENVTLDGTLI